MRRFFFNFTSGKETLVDDNGVPLNSLCAAHRHATAIICLAVLSVRKNRLRGWSVDITDATGVCLLNVPFFPWISRRNALAQETGMSRVAPVFTPQTRFTRPEGR